MIWVAVAAAPAYGVGMQIDIISDTICPWCFIGKRRLEAALAQRPDLDPTILWHPFQLNPDTPVEGLSREEYMRKKFGNRDYPKGFADSIRAAGASVGIDFGFERMARVPNTVRSHRLLHWANQEGKQDALVEVLFRIYFLEARDIGDPEVLIEAAAEAGMDGDTVRTKLDRGDDDEMVRTQDEYVRGMGVTGVPTFIINQKYALQGAQEPEAFLQVLDKIADELGSDAPAGESAAAD